MVQVKFKLYVINGAHSATTEPVCCTPPETGGSSKASTIDLTLAVSSDVDGVLPDLLTYDSVVYELKSNQAGVKVSKDGNGYQWVKRGGRKDDESELCLLLMTVVMS